MTDGIVTETQSGLEASLFAVTAQGLRESVVKVWVRGSERDTTITTPSLSVKPIHHFEIEVSCRPGIDGIGSTPFLEFVAPSPPQHFVDIGHWDWAKELLSDVLRCEALGSFNPQVWINDYACSLEQSVEFDCLPQLLRMNAKEVREMFKRGVDFDRLADGLHQRECHDGPFEVEVDEQRLVEMVHLFAGKPCEFGQMQDVSDQEWSLFCERASIVLREKGAPVQGLYRRPQPHSQTDRDQSARAVILRLYEALNDASLVVDASEGEEYAYQTEIEDARAFLGIDERVGARPSARPGRSERGG